jgi:NhaP-type Na+/H+ or K+/H+ antiporter
VVGAVGLTAFDVRWLDPVRDAGLLEHVTELAVVIALFSTGLKVERRLRWREWSTVTRLLVIGMPVFIALAALFGAGVMGLSAGAAIVLGAALAPTDPVLAGDIGVGPPGDEEEREPNFAITGEAGLNDGLAFPFVYLAIALSIVGTAPGAWLPHFLTVDVAWRIAVGCLAGVLVGLLLRRLFFRSPLDSVRTTAQTEGFVALAATFLTYGVTEMVEGYGFVAVFVCAVTIRAGERVHGAHGVLHSYIEQLERLLTVVVLVLLGGAVARGLLAGLSWREVLVAAAFLLLVRPLAGWISLLGGRTGPWERGVLAFFGVRGIGSIYYLAYALTEGEFAAEDQALWRFVGLVVVGSVLLHGVTAGPVIAALDRARERKAREETGSEEAAPRTAI